MTGSVAWRGLARRRPRSSKPSISGIIDVEQYHVGTAFLDRPECARPVPRKLDFEAARPQDVADDAAVILVVVDDQDERAHRGAPGRSARREDGAPGRAYRRRVA